MCLLNDTVMQWLCIGVISIRRRTDFALILTYTTFMLLLLNYYMCQFKTL